MVFKVNWQWHQVHWPESPFIWIGCRIHMLFWVKLWHWFRGEFSSLFCQYISININLYARSTSEDLRNDYTGNNSVLSTPSRCNELLSLCWASEKSGIYSWENSINRVHFILCFPSFHWFKQDAYVATMQLMWCIFHLLRLLLIVEPCHMATNEVS